MPSRECSDQSNIKRFSFGRKARLGDLYDASTETFCSGLSIFEKNVPQSLVYCEPRPKVECDIAFAESRLDRCKNLGLGLEEQVSVLGLDIPLRGSWKYLSPDVWNKGEMTVSLICRYHLFAEKLNLLPPAFKNLVSLESARHSSATHVVTEIELGSASVTSLSFCGCSERSKEDTANKLALHMLKAVDETIHTGYATTPSMDGAILEFFSDISTENQVPQTLDECAKSVRKFACSLRDNVGELNPVTYSLISLNTLEKIAGQTAYAQQKMTKHDESVMGQILDFLDRLESQKKRLRKLHHAIRKRHRSFGQMAIRDFARRREKICNNIEENRKDVAEKIKLCRLGKLCDADASASFRSWQCLLDETDQFFVSISVMTKKLEYLEKWERLGADVITDPNPEVLREKLEDGEHFVFYTKFSLMDDKFDLCSKTFEKLCRKDGAKCIFYDEEIFEAEGSEEHEDHSIVRYFYGDIFEEDVCRLDILLQNYNVVKIEKLLQEDVKRPNPRAQLRVACPRSLLPSGCSKEKKEWVCYHCEAVIDYGFNKFLYCDCGESDPFSALWYCRDPGHELECAEYNKEVLKKELDEVQKNKEFNVLLLGKTGSGKSTWINSIANYVIHDSLEAASQCDLTYLIPSSFTTQTLSGEEKKITVGENPNESKEEGESATQKPQAYTFMFNNALIRLIDVPGVCDTRGPEQDVRNFNLILQELQTITELHAICILLTPDTSRLTLSFKYCISELLTHLHKSAAKNIVFCFTKTRQTFYRAGQTLPVLRKYLERFEETRHVRIPLQPETMYYFDNEAFRLLCAIKNGVEFTNRQQQAFQESWDISANETSRFLNYVLGLEPHMTREMCGLNEARRLIVSMTEPLANISENVATNLRVVEDNKRELALLDLSVAELEARLYIPQITLKAKSIDYPRTVCSGPNCVELRTLPDTGQRINHYKQICHERCYLKGIEADKYPDPKLKNCTAMAGGKSETCTKCGCNWDMHLHRRHDQIQEEVKVIDKAAEALLKEKVSRKLEKQDVLNEYDRHIEKLEQRYQRITEICACFGAFLKGNSIVPYNDVMKRYLKQAIKMAEQEAEMTKNREKVDRLQSFLKKYKEELRILKSNLDKVHGKITLDDVMRMKEELHSMNSEDCNIAEYLKVVEQAIDKHYRRNDIDFDNGSQKKGGKTILKKARRWLTRNVGSKKTLPSDCHSTRTSERRQFLSAKDELKSEKKSTDRGMRHH